MKNNIWIIPLLILALTACRGNQNPVKPETALEAYIESADDVFAWEIREEFSKEQCRGGYPFPGTQPASV